MAVPTQIYRVTAQRAESSLLQGEILSNLVQARLDLSTVGTDAPAVEFVTHPFVLVLTQDCDLDQDFKARQGQNKEDKLIPAVLFCQLPTAEELRGTSTTTGITSEIWKRISQNKDERYHFLQKVEPACDALHEGLPETAIDFKRYFSMPTDEVYRRVEIGEARRRCVLVSPYMQHLCARFANYLSRVALPEDHFSEPPVKR